ncbi:MAG TPA: hypothetical protein VNA28_06495 [Solirubrobacteraceae bacterium]|nr:hypothetical protein [Solirubrobacteraceae bacterium]
MRTAAILCAVTATFVAVSSAPAEAPERPSGNFGGGAVAAPPRDIFGPGNAVIGLRALDDRKLEIEATVRGKCTGGDITAAVTIAADGTFSSEDTVTQQPSPGETVTTTYRLSGAFTSRSAVEGTLSATLLKSAAGKKATCKTGTVAFSARRPDGRIGKRGAEGKMRYYGTTAQRGVGPKRPIVLRVSGDGQLVSRALFGEQVKCGDGTRSIGVEAPSTNLRIGTNGRVKDKEKYTIDNGDTRTYVEDSFTAVIGRSGAKGTFSLSDRTIDKASGNIIQSCESGEIKWTAAP